jgi:CRP/FNR family transcriptional regulator, cyclic AMP receptor protein
MTTSEVLRAAPLFEGMTDRSIGKIAELADEVDYPVAAELVREGDPGDSFIVIVDGTAEVTQGGVPIRMLGPGDFLGEISLIDGGNRTATVTATTPIHALRVDRAGFARLIDEFPVVRLEIVEALAERVRQREPSALH